MSDNKTKSITLRALFEKEVINTCTGERLGYIDDGDVDLETGIIKYFSVPCRCNNPFSKKQEIRKFAFCDITKIGNDTILIKNCFAATRIRREKRKNSCKT